MEHDEDGRHSVVRRDVHEATGYPVATDSYVVHPVHHWGDNKNPVEAADDEPRGQIVPMDKSGNLKDAYPKVDESMGIEADYMDVPLPPWREQLTLRAFVVALVLGIAFSIVTHRLNLTVGIIPSLNVPAGLLGFFFIKTWVKLLTKAGFTSKPFTRQENTVIQTCVVSCYGIAFSGGFGSYLLGMSQFAYEGVGVDTKGNTVQDIKNPSLSWIYPFIFTVSLLGIFVLVPLRKIMIIDYRLTYPSGTATAVLINSFHTPSGAKIAKKQVKYLGKYFTFSFAWSFFKWFFSGLDNSCGFDTFPSLGLKAYANRFYFDFSMTYVGAGIICPHIVNVSVLFGAIVSWGLMWPLIQNREGDWYPAGLNPGRDFRGLFGYKVFISIAIILGDGLYNFFKVTCVTVWNLYIQHKNRQQLPSTVTKSEDEDNLDFDRKRRDQIFMKDSVPYWLALAGYVILAIISMVVIPHLFPSVKWYYVFVAYIIAPLFAFCNAYGCGLTDWSLASNYGKLLLFIFAAWAGAGGGGILAGLAACGVMMSIVATASDLMQDFKTGYMTLSSPRSMFTAQLIGGIMGCIVGPATFWLYWKAFDIGSPNSTYKAPSAVIYRTMALLGVEGFGSLPNHCLQLCAGWFAFAVVVNAIRDYIPKKYSRFIPIPMAMAIPFYIGAYFAIDMFIGTCIVFLWERKNKTKASTFAAAVASGLICGDGLWIIPTAILNFAKVNPPICMFFFRAKDPILATLG
ncbi:hypothetical protein R1flu_015735 [Riccia fluitans]|uniref:Metal-nicotianamine transporter YSL7 n=1 Tax=Riccia fluitans TaxID=41844 RepID=A0ABD1YKU6_9MARC